MDVPLLPAEGTTEGASEERGRDLRSELVELLGATGDEADELLALDESDPRAAEAVRLAEEARGARERFAALVAGRAALTGERRVWAAAAARAGEGQGGGGTGAGGGGGALSSYLLGSADKAGDARAARTVAASFMWADRAALFSGMRLPRRGEPVAMALTAVAVSGLLLTHLSTEAHQVVLASRDSSHEQPDTVLVARASLWIAIGWLVHPVCLYLNYAEPFAAVPAQVPLSQARPFLKRVRVAATAIAFALALLVVFSCLWNLRVIETTVSFRNVGWFVHVLGALSWSVTNTAIAVSLFRFASFSETTAARVAELRSRIACGAVKMAGMLTEHQRASDDCARSARVYAPWLVLMIGFQVLIPAGLILDAAKGSDYNVRSLPRARARADRPTVCSQPASLAPPLTPTPRLLHRHQLWEVLTSVFHITLLLLKLQAAARVTGAFLELTPWLSRTYASSYAVCREMGHLSTEREERSRQLFFTSFLAYLQTADTGFRVAGLVITPALVSRFVYLVGYSFVLVAFGTFSR